MVGGVEGSAREKKLFSIIVTMITKKNQYLVCIRIELYRQIRNTRIN